ncbi:MAG TPA: lipocalin family protein, partial [Chitinophagaceae bacterium]
TIKFSTMNKLILTTVLCFTALFFTNCDKNDNPPPSNTDYITKSSWKFSSAKAGGTDVTGQVPACFKDNTMLFVANGTGTINESTNVCTPATPSSFTWVFQNNGTEINMSIPIVSGGSTVFKIVLLNDVSMVVSQIMTIAPFPATNVELTFTH